MSGRSHGRGVFDDQDETAPMITQAAYELRQRDPTASPVTQAEEQVAIGRPSGRIGLGRGETQLHVVCRLASFSFLEFVNFAFLLSGQIQLCYCQ